MELVLFYARPEFVSSRVVPSSSLLSSSSREESGGHHIVERGGEGNSERNWERASDKETGNIVFVLSSSMPEKVSR